MTLDSDPDHHHIANEDESQAFDMSSLRTHLPRKRGLSKFFSGKSQSFMCISDVKSVEDLKKPEHPCVKRRKKYSNDQSLFLPSDSCRLVLNTPCRPWVGV